MKPTVPLGPWPLGIDNVSGRGALKSGSNGRAVALAEALNVDIDRAGRPARRAGRVLTAPRAGLHSLWSGANGSFAVAGSTVYSVPRMDPVATLNSADRCAYTTLNDATLVANRTTLLRIRHGSSAPLAIPDASAPTLQAHASGALDAGRYLVAVSLLRDGVEGGLSGVRAVDVGEGQGIDVTHLPSTAGADTIRLYRSAPRGETLYRAATVPMGTASHVLGASALGRATTTGQLRRMRPGSFVAAWRGRVLTAQGRWLYVSQPMQPHLCDVRHGFVPFAGRIRMLAPVDGGVFVGTRHGVVFLRGPRPSEWVQVETPAAAPFPGHATTIEGAKLDPGWDLGNQTCALWLSPRGFVLGTEAGRVIELQADHLALQAPRAALCVHGRRVTAAVQ